jgi:hypothetical protein
MNAAASKALDNQALGGDQKRKKSALKIQAKEKVNLPRDGKKEEKSLNLQYIMH